MKQPSQATYEKKIWGQTALVSKRPGFTVHHLVVVPGSFCSVHLHDNRFNAFFVTKGEMVVREFPEGAKENEPSGEVVLKAGDYYEVAPRVIHQFLSSQGCEALEIYFPPDVDEGDIHRFTVGGLLGQAK